MALKLGKLDAICARLKKTSAAEQRNGVQTAITEVAPIDLRATKDTSSNSCANNNNEDTVTDLNENPSTNLVVPETDVCAQDVKSIPVPTPFAHIQPTYLTSTPISQFNASSSRRKSRKAAKPRIVAQINESELFDSEFDEHESESYGHESESYGHSRYLEKNVLLHLSKEETDSMDTSDDSEGAHKGYMPFSAQLNQYSLLKQLRESEDLSVVDLHSKQDGNCSSVPLDLSTNKTSDGSASSLEKSSHLSINNSQSNTVDFSQNTTTDALTSAASFSNVASPTDHPNNTEAKGLADFAENTMNELLRIYGFGGAGVEGVGKGLAGKRLGNLSVNKTLSIKTKIKLQPTSSPSAGMCLINKVSNGQSHFKDASVSASSLSSGEENSAATTPDLDQNKKTKLTESLLKSKLNILKQGGTTHKVSSSDYNKYIKKFHNGVECGGSHCRDLGYREHYHCHDCSFKAFVKKEEMVRHYKWHKKRDESMQHGFLRFSPLDDCSIKYGVCTHNGRQTHYHCMQAGCDKVYISTSDVQMHANYHRKDSAIIQEGFQRFRATEDCGTTTCSFYGQRTTHFHCRRSTCNFTFKNKADMEKHKSYHQKDEILGKDGFKKFMKYEFCNFQGCRFSKVSNHIHCIRSGCSYVLHSTAQLYSHKRKHERREFENIYRCFRQTHRSPSLPVQSGVPSATLSQPGMPSATLSQSGQTTAVEQITQSSKDLLPTVKPAPDPQIDTSNTVSSMNQLVGTQIVKSGQVMKPVSIPLTNSKKIALPSSLKLTFASTPSVSSATSTATSVDNKNITSNSSHYIENDICGPASADVKIKQEPKSEDESESEEEQPLHIQMSTAPEEKTYTPETKFDLKKENLIDPVELPTSNKTVTKIERLDELKEQQVEKLPIDPSTDDSSVTINTSTSLGPMPIVPLMSAMKKLGAPEKKERDETWKTYLIRYTANDPCNSRCQLLYKDHYHCKIPGCQVLFRSKDGVREHAKFHDLQDRITPLVYDFFEDTLACPQNCQYSHKEKHYHCNWTGCTHVITVTGPTFARLEHHRIHEYARAAAGKNYRSQSGSICRNDDSLSQRRRGRPPKYPKNGIPYVPKVELSENEIKDSACQLPETNTIEDNSKIVNGFKKFEAGEQCPDPQCLYFSQKHYHCGRPRCHTATDRIDVLNLHAKDFHSFVSIMEHFEFFDRNVNCRRTHCQNNRTNRHYHCTRPRCDYSFVRHSTMNQHDKKHTTPSAPASVQSQPLLATTTRITPIQLIRHPDGQTYIPIVPAIDPQNKSIVKAAGTFYPLTALGGIPTPGIPLTTAQVGVMTSGGAQQLVSTTLTFTIPATMVTAAIPVMAQALTSTSTGTSMVPIITTGTIGTGAGPSGSTVTGAPLTVLLQQKSGNGIPQPSWSAMRNSMHYSLQASCGRPFCKLKKKDHFHCLECNQAFSDPSRLRGHISKHGVKFKKLEPATRSIRPFPVTVLNAPNLSAKVALDFSKGKEAGTIDENKESTSKETANNALENDEDDSEEDEENKEISKIPSATNLPLHLQNKVELNPVNDIEEINEEAPLVIDEETNDSYDDEDASSHIDQSMDDSLDITEMSNDFETSLSPVNFSSETKERGGKISLCSRRSSRKRTATKHDDFINSDDAALAKQMKLKLNAPIPSTVPRTNKQIPEGFIRFHCSNDCYYSSCAYRHTVTHYHCVRPECGYGFSDKSRIIQHRTRHERIDKLMGEDFQQYRATVSCHQCDCVFSEKASHFHCCKCSFVCADSSKVLAHRKYHAKLDNIVNNGFQKFTGTEDCHIASCTYHCKQTHYHCTHKGCNHAVLGPAQMAPHKLKHACREV